MALWIGINSIYKKVNSLKEYAEGRMTHRAPNRVKVFKSVKKLKEGLDYTNYEWDGENLKKSNAQPAVEINQLLSQMND
tara:strand:- start:166 stop:402 length:237 start_codon:yes stop_codon:yes gene_type:complete